MEVGVVQKVGWELGEDGFGCKLLASKGRYMTSFKLLSKNPCHFQPSDSDVNLRDSDTHYKTCD